MLFPAPLFFAPSLKPDYATEHSAVMSEGRARVSEDYVQIVSAKQFGADPSFGGQAVSKRLEPLETFGMIGSSKLSLSENFSVALIGSFLYHPPRFLGQYHF
jgi:hypothetical protein